MKSRSAARTFVAFMRGVNVGGKNRLPMAELLAIFRDEGCSDARAYIQSGNVVFTTRPARAARIPAAVERAVAKRFGFATSIVLRTADELALIVTRNPFARTRTDVGALHVAFLADEPTAARIAVLDPDRSPPDRYSVRGREVYLHCPNGMGRTKLTNQYFESKLATRCTIRNWQTVLELLDMSSTNPA